MRERGSDGCIVCHIDENYHHGGKKAVALLCACCVGYVGGFFILDLIPSDVPLSRSPLSLTSLSLSADYHRGRAKNSTLC